MALGNIGSMLAGLAALLVAAVTFPQIPGGVRTGGHGSMS
jgi:hypothetical protein